MSFMDALGLVSDAQALTATAFSTNTIDLGAENPSIGTGEEVGFGISVDAGADITTGNETYTIEVVQSANADLSAPDVLSSRVVVAADLALASLLFVAVPMGTPTKRYLGLRYTLGGTTPLLTVTAWLTARSLFSIAARRYSKNYTA